MEVLVFPFYTQRKNWGNKPWVHAYTFTTWKTWVSNPVSNPRLTSKFLIFIVLEKEKKNSLAPSQLALDFDIRPTCRRWWCQTPAVCFQNPRLAGCFVERRQIHQCKDRMWDPAPWPIYILQRGSFRQCCQVAKPALVFTDDQEQPHKGKILH